MSTAKKEFKQALMDMVADGLTDVQISETIGARSAAEVRRLKGLLGITEMKLWICPECGFKMLANDRPRCQRHSIHWRKHSESLREGGFDMEEVQDE